MQCPRCGSQAGEAAFCTTCGAGLRGAQPQPPASGGGNKLGLVLAGLLIGVLIAGAVAGAYFLGSSPGDDEPAAEKSTETESPAPAEDDEDAEDEDEESKPPTRNSGPGDVRDLPAGLFCRDLQADSYSYSAAVDYWRLHGQPDHMDANRDGIPCETVYPADRVRDYWGDRMPSADAPTYVPPAGDSYLDLPAGLMCKDLYSRGYSYGDALSYWYFWAMPDRMDADLNGIPCETVYPKSTVDLYW